MSRWYKYGKALLQEIADSQPQSEEAYIWFAGQHGFMVNLGRMVFYIDVILNDLVNEEGKSIRVYPPPFEPGEIQKVDYVLCTHNHIDHLNLETLLPLSKANPMTHFVVPAPWKHLLIQAGIGKDRILSAKAGESLVLLKNTEQGNCAPVTLIPVPAIHTRYIQDDGEKDYNGDYTSLGFVLMGDGLKIYHSGDTWITPLLVSALKAIGALDIAMLPINGTDWERTWQNYIGNASPLDIVKLARTIPIDLVIPSHYDMIANNSENPARFVDSMYTLCPEKRFHVFAPGERFIYRQSRI